MAVENWKLWLVPFAVWALVMVWYSGYQSGYQEGHVTAWQMYHPNLVAAVEAQAQTQQAHDADESRLADR